MAAFNYTQPPDATGEQDTSYAGRGRYDVYPDLNGQANSLPTHGNGALGGFAGPSGVVITGITQLTQGLMWTALYGLAGPNTITIQFSAPLTTVSTTTGDYTLSGPSAPSITSVTAGTLTSYANGLGSRNVQLNLSGPLSSVNTYTLQIANQKIHSGDIDIDVISTTPGPVRVGVWNWPGYIVDVIMPATINCIGVGIEQDVVFGSPNIDTAGAAVAVGIEQDIALGTPVVNTITAQVGVGIEQDIVLGTPSDAPNVVNTTVGIAQVISLGTPVVTQQQEPIGVGFVETIALGTPIADINPLTPTGVGIQETISLGTPVVAGPANVSINGIAQIVALGTPVMSQPTSFFTGVGIEQDIVLGTPIMGQAATMNPVPFDQTIHPGTPVFDPITPEGGIGISQPILLGNPSIILELEAITVGIEQDVALGTPAMAGPQNTFGVGINQPAAVGIPIINHEFFQGVGIEQDIALGLPVSLTALTITDRQHDAFINLDAALQKAYADGVDGNTPDLMLPIGDLPTSHDYRDLFTPLQQHQTKVPFENLACATWVALNMPGELDDTNDNDTTTLAALSPTGTTGSLTWVDGVLVAKVDPLGTEHDGEGIAQAVGVGVPGMSHT